MVSKLAETWAAGSRFESVLLTSFSSNRPSIGSASVKRLSLPLRSASSTATWTTSRRLRCWMLSRWKSRWILRCWPSERELPPNQLQWKLLCSLRCKWNRRLQAEGWVECCLQETGTNWQADVLISQVVSDFWGHLSRKTYFTLMSCWTLFRWMTLCSWGAQLFPNRSVTHRISFGEAPFLVSSFDFVNPRTRPRVTKKTDRFDVVTFSANTHSQMFEDWREIALVSTPSTQDPSERRPLSKKLEDRRPGSEKSERLRALSFPRARVLAQAHHPTSSTDPRRGRRQSLAGEHHLGKPRLIRRGIARVMFWASIAARRWTSSNRGATKSPNLLTRLLFAFQWKLIRKVLLIQLRDDLLMQVNLDSTCE